MKRTDVDKVLIIGSGPIVIGQACEFDYSGTQACKALRACGYKVVLVNSNPATIMTDPVMADATYIEPLNEARLEQIIEKERPDAILPNLGGQTGLNLSMELAKKGILDKYGVQVIGVNLGAIERGKRPISSKLMKRIHDRLGLSYDFLLDGMSISGHMISQYVRESTVYTTHHNLNVLLKECTTLVETFSGKIKTVASAFKI